MNALWSLYNATDGANWIWYDPSEPQYFEGAVWNFTPSANPCAEQWQGITCNDVFSHVTNLTLPLHCLNGSISAEIGQLPQLLELDLSDNALSGSIPAEIEQLMQLQVLDLGANELSGSIPVEIGRLTKLLVLDLDSNALSGSIPAEIGQLTQLQELYLDINALTDSIPIEITALTQLRFFDLGSNNLSGVITAEIGLLTQLQELNLASNELSGSIPVELGQLTQLQYLQLFSNKLSGSIPKEIGQLTHLQELSLNSNALSGTLPSEVEQLTQLQLLYLFHNQLSGSIPAELGQLTQLWVLYLDFNNLSGSIPPEIGQLAQLVALNLNSNKLSGSIPAEIGQLTLLQALGLSSNKFSGSIPTPIGQLIQLEALYLDFNFLSGSIPAEIGQLAQLQALKLNANFLFGRILGEIVLLSLLQVLALDTNVLSGSIPAGIAQLTLLEIFNVADNALTGSIPDKLFQLRKLSALIAGKNCFVGELPQSVCGATALVSLNLDGLHTAQQCSKRQVPFTYLYGGAGAFYGTIPACVFELPLLTSLHLSGNGLTGTIPANLSADAVLTDLVLSHNSLVGSIPASIQLRAWTTLDLSYNRLDGTLLSSFGDGGPAVSNASASVYLKNNRLSGLIPTFLVHLADVEILGSNIFSCGADRSDLPENDEDRERYQCGSNAFSSHLFAALATVMVLIAALWMVRRRQCGSQLDAAVNFAEKWLLEATLNGEDLPQGVNFLHIIGALLLEIAFWCTLAIVLCLIPWYAVAHSQYGTYTHAYAWVVSAAFLSGLVPAVTELALYCALMVAVVIGGTLVVVKGNRQSNNRVSSIVYHQDRTVSSFERVPISLWYLLFLHALFFVTNLIVVLLVNVGFVAASLQADHAVLTVVSILYTAFKLFWNMVCTPYMIDYITAHTGRRRVSSSLVTIHMLLSILNNIVIPCLVVAVQSPSCFLNVFEASPTVTADYSVPGCVAAAFVDDDGGFEVETLCTTQFPIPIALQFEPHFSYSYQCSSSFITYYSPVFVLMGITAGVLIPVAKAVSLYCLMRAVPGTRWHQVLCAAVPRILRPIDTTSAPPLPSHQEALTNSPTAMLRRLREERVFNGVTAVDAMITYLGILLTFGVVFPPLAVIMCATMWSVYWQTRLILGKFVHDAQAAGAVHLIERLEQDCRSVVSMQTLRRVMFLITCISCCFYALFLFDTLGDARGAADSYWIFLVMALFPVVLYVLSRALRTMEGKLGTAERAGAYVDDNMFEMATISPGLVQQLEEGSSQGATAAVIVSQERERSAGCYVAGMSEVESAAGVTVNALHSDT